MIFFTLGCKDASQRGGDEATGTTDTTEQATPEETTMEEETTSLEEPEEPTEPQSAPEEVADPEPQPTPREETSPAPAPKPSYTRIAYREGTTSQVSGSIQGSGTQQYISTLPAKALIFKLLTDNSAARLMVTDTNGKRLSTAGQEVTYTPPAEGDYLIKVFMNMANDASSQKADYRLQIRAAE